MDRGMGGHEKYLKRLQTPKMKSFIFRTICYYSFSTMIIYWTHTPLVDPHAGVQKVHTAGTASTRQTAFGWTK